MSDPTPRFTMGGLRQFVAVYSAAPGTTPYHAIYQTSGGTQTLVSCATATSSSTTEFYRFFAMPNSFGRYVSEWVASFTNGPVVHRDLFEVVRTR